MSINKESGDGLTGDDPKTLNFGRPQQDNQMDLDFDPDTTDSDAEIHAGEAQEGEATATPTTSTTSSSKTKDVLYKDLFDCLKKGNKGESQVMQIARLKEYIITEYGPIAKTSETIVNKNCTSFVKRVRELLRGKSNTYSLVEDVLKKKLKTKFTIMCGPDPRPVPTVSHEDVEMADPVPALPPEEASAHNLVMADPVSSPDGSPENVEMEDLDTAEAEPGTSSQALQGTPHSTKYYRVRQAAKKLKDFSPNTLVKVAARNIHVEGRHKDASRVRDSIRPEPEPPETEKPVFMTPEEALCLLLDLHLSQDQYKKLRLNAKAHNAQIWPKYDDVLAAKKACRPTSGFEVNDGSAKVSLQSLLDHTASRIIKMLNEGVSTWGFDGSTGQAVYKQQMNAQWDSSSLFTTHLIPLQLIDANGTCIWKNPSPQSVRFCRPLNLMFVKETTNVSLAEKKRVEEEIRTLQSFTIQSDDSPLTISYKLVLTLIDGKVLNAITGTKSPLTCPICNRSISTFNEFEARKEDKVQAETLQHGLSPLHAWIRCFEFILHIAYRLPVKRWRISSDTDKAIVQKEKQRIQQLFKDRLHLLVDIPKTGGFGSTNDGNTSRRAFANAEVFAEITGVDLQLIKDLRNILIAINCDLSIDEEKFDAFCTNVAKRYVSLYSWCHMTTTVHKLLVHGGVIIQNSIVPIGMLGEEASEGRNKYYKYNRLHHARKDNPIHTMEDVFWRAMDHSDPYLSLYNTAYNKRKNNKKILPSEVINLLKGPEIQAQSDEDATSILTNFSEEFAVELDSELDL